MKTRDYLLLSIGFALLFIAVHGYQFNGGDQEEHLPFVYRLMDPSLYNKDYIVPYQTSHFSIRFYFAHLIKAGAQILPISSLVFLLYFTCLTIVGWVIATITFQLSKSHFATFISLFFIVVFNNFTVGGNSFIDVQLTCSVFSLALGAIAFYYFTKGKMVFTAAFCGLSSLFQVLMGLHLFALLSILTLFIVNKHKWLNSIKYLSVYLLFAGWMLFPLIAVQFGTIKQLENQLYYDILFHYRNAHHYDPFCFLYLDYLKTILWWGIILFSVYFGSRKQQLNSYAFLIYLLVLGCCFYIVGFSFFNLASVGKLQWFKATIWPGLFGTIPVAIFLSEKISGFQLQIEKYRLLLGLFILIGFLVINNSALLPSQKLRTRYKLGNCPHTHLENMHSWIAKNTDKNAVFLTFPNDDSFLCEAKRNLPVGYKAIIHQPDFLIPWYNQMKNIYGVGLSSDKCMNVMDELTFLYPQRTDQMIKSSLKIDFRLWDLDQVDSAKINWNQLIHREGNILLLRFPQQP